MHLADINQLMEKRPSLKKFLSDIPAYTKEGEKAFLEKRFSIENFLVGSKTPIMAVFTGKHYGMSVKQLHIFKEIAEKCGVPYHAVELEDEARDFSTAARDKIITEWNVFLKKHARAETLA